MKNIFILAYLFLGIQTFTTVVFAKLYCDKNKVVIQEPGFGLDSKNNVVARVKSSLVNNQQKFERFDIGNYSFELVSEGSSVKWKVVKEEGSKIEDKSDYFSPGSGILVSNNPKIIVRNHGLSHLEIHRQDGDDSDETTMTITFEKSKVKVGTTPSKKVTGKFFNKRVYSELNYCSQNAAAASGASAAGKPAAKKIKQNK